MNMLIKNNKLQDLYIKEIERKEAIKFMSENHYSKSCPKVIALSLGFYWEEKITTMIVFSIPASPTVLKAVANNSHENNSWELSRLFSFDWCPKNIESYCIGQSIKYIKNNYPKIKYLISFADGNWGHHGYIYQATNWIFTGQSTPRRKFFIDGKQVHEKTLVNRYGTSSVKKLKNIFKERLEISRENKGKYRYVFIISQNKKEYKQLYSELKYKALPYPKGDNLYYNIK